MPKIITSEERLEMYRLLKEYDRVIAYCQERMTSLRKGRAKLKARLKI